MMLGPEIDEAQRAIVAILESMRVPYALGGAIAMSYHRYVRATRDIDFLILLPAVQVQAFADALNAAGFRMHDDNDQPVAVEVAPFVQSTRDLGLCRVWWKHVRVELFVPKVPLQDSVLKRRFRVEDGAAGVWVTTVEDLILLKMIFHRDKDLVDVRRLIAANRDTLDRAYVESWIPKTLTETAGRELRDMLQAAAT
ncbi:MAG: hypothetical protein FD180_3064 [Planctomycetota bacterium]|nr:MAG: hypothetical protein FD180_3064 [Planctomycetota bacterium]